MRLARHGAAPLLLVTLVLVAFAGVLSPDEGLYFRDHSLQFRLRGAQVREHLLEGRLPALTRADDGGHPLENQLNGTYLPFTLILLVGDFDVSYDWFVIAHYVVLVLGALGLARHLGLARPEAALAASLAGLAGPLLSLENLQGALHGLAIMPWTWWALLRLFEAPSPRRAAAFALALGFEYQGTEPVLMCLDLGFGVLALVWLRPRAVALGWCAAGVLLGFGLAAVELLPVLDNLPHTPRGRGFDYTMASAWPLRPELFIEFLAPSFWGPPDYPFIQFPSINGVNGHRI